MTTRMMMLKRFYASLGRPSNNLTSGIVGLANVGKSTFFQAITKSKLGNPANYPFATIEPEESKVIVPSSKLDHLYRLYESQKKIPSTLTVFDIAGLTRGASSGEGLGNKFLNDIRHVDGIFQVVRGFENDEITHIEGNVDPVRDLSLVQDELVLKDLEWLEGARERINKKINRAPKNSTEFLSMSTELKLLDEVEAHMYEGKKLSHWKKDWSEEEINILNKHNFLTAKPTLILLNVTPKDYLLQENKFLDKINKWLDAFAPGDQVMLFSAELETKYNEFEDDLQQFEKYCKEITNGQDLKAPLTALPAIIVKMRELLQLISFYTCGPIEARQWTILKGTMAPQAAGVIHSDLEQTFISANIIKYEDVKEMEPPLQESALKSQGKIKRGGKQYVVEDGDIIHFKAANGKK